jgi:3-methylcrotonyl-CoA carboxylase alpha subunit
VHLYERDCSVQRRHQKVLEEAPAPGMSEERRRTMGETAVAAAKAIGYVGAGTVEFIVDATAGTVDTFHFMEMNTRLQVEHPVTEMITGLDLVEWQLRVAANEPLPLTQDALRITGHAIEARIYAEDAERGFLPSIGRIDHLSTPSASPHVRIDTGVRQGDEISQYYDPMIAKLIVWADDRAEALRHLRGALAAYHVVGVATNVSFLQRVVTHDAFALASVDTGLIARHHAELFPPDPGPTARELAIAALDEFLRLVEDADAATKASADRYSPWSTVQSWWLNSSDRAIDFTFVEEHGSHPVALRLADGGFGVDTKGVSLRATADRGDDVLHVTLDGVYMKASVVIRGQERYLFHAGRMRRLQLADPLASTEDEEHHGGRLTAPMSGSIVAVLVGAGEQVAKGAPLLILEAMKMEHTISAPSAGRVVAVNFAKGDQVREGADLIELDEAEPTP